jgi:ribosomal protein L24E
MKKKRETCKYCGEKMDAKTTRQEFCSDKCRVYWNRENERPDTPKWVDQDLNEIPKDKEPPKGTTVSIVVNSAIQSDVQKEIEELKKQFLNKK